MQLPYFLADFGEMRRTEYLSVMFFSTYYFYKIGAAKHILTC
jgi:hypothetical protein